MVLTGPQGHGLQRIHLDGPRPCADGHDAKLRVEGQGAGLVGEAMLHSLQGWGGEGGYSHRHGFPRPTLRPTPRQSAGSASAAQQD